MNKLEDEVKRLSLFSKEQDKEKHSLIDSINAREAATNDLLEEKNALRRANDELIAQLNDTSSKYEDLERVSQVSLKKLNLTSKHLKDANEKINKLEANAVALKR